MLSSSLIAVRDDGRMSSPGPRSGGPTSRRSFTSTQKLDHLAAYEAAVANGQWTHNITALDGEATTLFWTNEQFDPDHPDTYWENVRPEAG